MDCSQDRRAILANETTGLEESARMRGALPNFLIIGAMRSGTTSLARAISAHPDAFMFTGKEIHFFDRHFDRGLDWYRSQFTGVAGEGAVGESTPAYMYVEWAVPRIAEVLPNVKLTAVLRNPVDRAYSHYWRRRGLRREKRGFSEAIREEMRLDVPGYLTPSRYLPQLQRVLQHFPREALHVIIFEEYARDPHRVYASLSRFLGIDDAFVPPGLGERVNPSRSYRSSALLRYTESRPRSRLKRVVARLNARKPRPYPPMDRGIRQELLETFREHNAALAGVLGKDLSAWDA